MKFNQHLLEAGNITVKHSLLIRNIRQEIEGRKQSQAKRKQQIRKIESQQDRLDRNLSVTITET